jgi:hypothetical protein
MAKKTGRPAKWQTPTTAIRVPEHLAPQLLALARQMEQEGSVQNSGEESYLISVETLQGLERYLVRAPVDLTADETQLLDEAVDYAMEIMEGLKPDERWLVVGELAKAWGQKLKG